MEFECITTPVLRPVLNSKGVTEPLCNTCAQSDCSNPIKSKQISVFGKIEKWNVLVSGNQAYQVVTCTGYMD